MRTRNPSPWLPVCDSFTFIDSTEDLQRLLSEHDMKDREQSEREMKKTREDFSRQIHDHKMASEILAKPFGEGCSSGSGSGIDGDEEGAVFRVYFKGLVSEESVTGEKFALAGIGVAICDLSDNLITEVSKSLLGNGTSKIVAELKALIEAFNAAIALNLKRVIYFCDYYPLFQFATGKWPAKQRKIAMLVHQVNLLQRKFTYCSPRLVARHNLKFAFKLAKDAIVSQSRRPAESGSRKSLNETCVICLEDTDINQFFLVDGCQHRYCFSCMKQHVEVKLLLGMVPKCPHEGCNNELLVDSCRKFLTSKLVETMQQRKLEASIPVSEKIYCPYPRCSALMSKTEALQYSKNLIGSEQSGPKKCIKCHGLFCFSCKVPWHSGMTCSTYKRLNPNPPAEDVKLKSLASRSLWRQCVKCNHMIELAEGCYHMTCRCGYEFCYNCGAEWKDKKATCSCPLWAVENIRLEDSEREWEEEEEIEDNDYYNSDYYDDFLLSNWPLDWVDRAEDNIWLEDLEREWEEEEEDEDQAKDIICLEDQERELEEDEDLTEDNVCFEDHEKEWEEEEEEDDEDLTEDSVCFEDQEREWEEDKEGENEDEDRAEDSVCLEDHELEWEEEEDLAEDKICLEDHEREWEEEEEYEDDDCYSSDYCDDFY